jgi:hypothetical protein
MLARGGGPGGWNYPEVPVLELEYPCVSNSFQALAKRPELLIPYPHRVVKPKCHMYREKSWIC